MKSKTKFIVIAGIIGVGAILFASCCSGFSVLSLLNIPAGNSSQSEEIKGVQEQKVEEIKLYEVREVVDGDTIKIDYDGNVERVRLIGIDTPETKECFNEEATNKLKSLVAGKSVKVEFDESQSERDKYDRLLLYIWQGENFVNKTMVKQGFAFEYTYNFPYKYQQEFKNAQKEAKNAKLGLWGTSCACKNDKEVKRECIACKEAQVTYTRWDCSEYTKKVTDSSCTSGCYTAPVVTAPQEQTPIAPKCQYSCISPDRDCSDFANYAEALAFWNCCGFTKYNDPMRLDGRWNTVDDGDPCESLK